MERRPQSIPVRRQILGLLAALVLLFPVISMTVAQPGNIRNYQGSLVVVDELILLANDNQTAAELEAVIAPYGGVLVHEFPDLEEIMGMHVARFPVDRLEDLEAIQLAIQKAGVRAYMSFLGELFT